MHWHSYHLILNNFQMLPANISNGGGGGLLNSYKMPWYGCLTLPILPKVRQSSLGLSAALIVVD